MAVKTNICLLQYMHVPTPSASSTIIILLLLGCLCCYIYRLDCFNTTYYCCFYTSKATLFKWRKQINQRLAQGASKLLVIYHREKEDELKDHVIIRSIASISPSPTLWGWRWPLAADTTIIWTRVGRAGPDLICPILLRVPRSA